MAYPQEFEEFFEAFCENHGTPTEGYDDAKQVAFTMWSQLPPAPTEPLPQTVVMIDEIELTRALEFAKARGSGNDNTIKLRFTQTGIAATVEAVSMDETTSKNVTNFDNW